MRTGTRVIWAAALLAAFLFVGVQAQEGFTKKTRTAASTTNGPLTQAELYASIEKAESAVRRVVLAANPGGMAHRSAEDRPAKRTEVIAEFGRLFTLARPHFKFTPRFVKYDPKVLSIPLQDAARKPLEDMIKFGFVGRIGPIAAGSAPTLTLDEYGDALGFFLARMGDLTHTPSAKWSPYLFGHKDFP